MDADRKKKLIACLLLMINVVGVLAMVDNGDLIQEMVCNDDSLRRKRDRDEMERSEMATMKILLSYHAPPQHPLPRILLSLIFRVSTATSGLILTAARMIGKFSPPMIYI